MKKKIFQNEYSSVVICKNDSWCSIDVLYDPREKTELRNLYALFSYLSSSRALLVMVWTIAELEYDHGNYGRTAVIRKTTPLPFRKYIDFLSWYASLIKEDETYIVESRTYGFRFQYHKQAWIVNSAYYNRLFIEEFEIIKAKFMNTLEEDYDLSLMETKIENQMLKIKIKNLENIISFVNSKMP